MDLADTLTKSLARLNTYTHRYHGCTVDGSDRNEECVVESEGIPPKSHCVLQGDATNQEDILSRVAAIEYGMLVQKADFARQFLGHFFRRQDVVLEMASKVKGSYEGGFEYSQEAKAVDDLEIGAAWPIPTRRRALQRHRRRRSPGRHGDASTSPMVVAAVMAVENM